MENKSLSDSLMDSWTCYKKEVQLSRKKKSRSNIHKLRVATRKLEAVLRLSKVLVTNKQTTKVLKNLKKTRHGLSALRNLQVEEFQIRRFDFRNHNIEILQKKIASDLVISSRECSKLIDGLNLKKLSKNISEIERKLLEAERKMTTRDIKVLFACRQFLNLCHLRKTLEKINPKVDKELHRFRTEEKKLRYEKEFIIKLLNSGEFGLKKLKSIQNRTGDYLDLKRLKEKILTEANMSA